MPALDNLINTIPVVLVGGMAMNMTEKMFSQVPSPNQQNSMWQPISKKEVYELLTKKKVNLLQKNPGKVYKWGYDQFKFENGQFWLA